MSIDFTLFAQVVVFALLTWFTMKFVWPVILQAMEARESRIAEGLAAAEKGHRDLEEAEQRASAMLSDGKTKAQEYIVQAQKRAEEIVEEAKETARAEGERIRNSARAEIDAELNQTREQLRARVAALAVAGAERILMREVDERAHREILEQLSANL